MSEELDPVVAPDATAEVPAIVPPPAEKKKRRKKMTPGEEIIALLEESGDTISDEERATFLSMRDDRAMTKFMGANVGDTVKCNEATANSVFASRLFARIKVLPLIMSQHFDNLAQSKKCIDFAAVTLAEDDQKDPGKKMSYEDRANAVKTMILGVRERGILLGHMAKLAKELKQVEPPATQPKNKAPDSLSTTNVAVQVNMNGATLDGEQTECRLLK